MYCVSVGEHENSLWQPEFADEYCISLVPNESDIKKQSQVFAEWCIKNNISLVIGANSLPIISSIPHLPVHIKVVSRCPSIFEDAINNSTINSQRINAFVALSPRIDMLLKEKLICEFHNKVTIIPNGVNIPKRNILEYNVIKLIWLGRIEHQTKGVFHLPKILLEIEKIGIKYHLTIIGKGKDTKKLQSQLQLIDPRHYIFTGELLPREVEEILVEGGIFLFTSHFEGSPNALLEAIAAGCIPVSWKLDGITDFIIEDGKTGYLHTLNDYYGMAMSIQQLYRDSKFRLNMSNQVAEVARERFSNEVCALAYSKVFDSVLKEQNNIQTPLSWDFYRPVQAEKSKYSFIPKGIRRTLRNILSQF
jgi:glycosyltransferase involved in cell wall biosynthesis